MRAIMLFSVVCLIFVPGCFSGKSVSVSEPVAETCPLPGGYGMEGAVATAEKTLAKCPEKLDEVFSALLQVAAHSPGSENAIFIQDMLKVLIQQNKVSEVYSKRLYQQYFSRSFVSVPDVRVHRLSGEAGAIRTALKKELGMKRIGMIECSGDKASYQVAEAEYARIISFMENLLLNDEYVKSRQY